MRSFFQLGLAFGMLVTGSINTISTKLADNQNVTGIDGGPPRKFNHPFAQAAFMFLGEALCLLTFYSQLCCARDRKKVDTARPFSPLIFLLPALCDMCATSTMYVGLNLTHASVFQMLRGSVVIFTGIFSRFFLKRQLHAFNWLGMVLVLAGSAIVGIASVTGAKGDDGGGASNPLLGDILIVAAQVITAFQMVVEEKFVNGRKIPALQAVGWEGVWGFSVLSLVLIAMYYMPGVPALGSSPDHFEDTPDAFVQIKNSPALLAACLGNIFSIAFFNFFGISVTKSMSAAHRMVLDSLRTIVIWAVSLSVGWQKHFSYLQLVGFIVLLAGTMVYNEVVHIPGLYYPEKGDESESQRELLRHEASGPHTEADNHLGAPGGPGSPPPALDDQWFSPKLTHYQAMSKA